MKKVGKSAYSSRLKNIPCLLSLVQYDSKRYPAILESKSYNSKTGRYSFVFEATKTLQAHTREECLALLEQIQIKFQTKVKPPLPFYSGWFLYFAYESVKAWEPALSELQHDEKQPLMAAIKSPAAVIIDHKKNKSWVVGKSKKRVKSLKSTLRQARRLKNTREKSSNIIDLANKDFENYQNSVEKVKEYIKQGDVYQVNLARSWRSELKAKPCVLELYKNLSHHNPSPFAGMMQLKGFSVVSSSPERLVSVRSRVIETRPIAGTRPRGETKEQDQALIDELIQHPKEQAEHIMLIDLERNDLGRVCKSGSVIVDELMSVESYAKVHHIVSNVKGKLKKNIDVKDVVVATFPGGTITGCPKIRCMQIIDELEQGPRGAYTGSMGYISNHGEMDLNILIRTISVVGNELKIKAGAGIVFDSIAENEAKESEYKAQALLNSLK